MVNSKLVRLLAKNSRELRDGLFETYLGFSDMNSIRSIALKSAIFNNNVPNIMDSGNRQNNEFLYDLGGPIQTLTIPQGFYSATQLADLITLELDAQAKLLDPGNSITVSVDPVTFKFKFETVGGFILGLQGNTGSLNKAIGNTETVFVAGTYQVTDYSNLAGLQSVAIGVRTKNQKTLINLNEEQGLWTNSLSIIPVTVPWGVNQTYINPDLSGSVLRFSLTDNLVKIRFSIRDADGNLVPNQKNHLVIELAVTYE